MKRIMLLIVLACLSHLSNGQEKEILPQGSNDTAVANKIEVLEQKLNDQEAAMQIIKRENEGLKKQLKQLKSQAVINGGGNKVSVSRRGSKQVIND